MPRRVDRSRQSSPSAYSSESGGTSRITAGTPDASASKAATPIVSSRVGNRKTSPAANAPRRSSIQPVNVTFGGGRATAARTAGLAAGPVSYGPNQTNSYSRSASRRSRARPRNVSSPLRSNTLPSVNTTVPERSNRSR
jgi:hypothetical protein